MENAPFFIALASIKKAPKPRPGAGQVSKIALLGLLND